MKKDIEVLEIKNFSEPDTSLLILDDELKIKRKRKMIITTITVILVVFFTTLLLLYGPYKGFKNWIIEKSVNSEFIQVAIFLYGNGAINEVIEKNYIKEPFGNTKPEEITFINENVDNKYEKEILNSNVDYKVIKINENNIKGYLIAIYNIDRISLETDYSKILNKKIAINAGSLYNNSVQGMIIQDGKLLIDNTKANVAGGIIGFNQENKLILGKYTSIEALNTGINNAIEYGPFLIVNGKSAIISGNGGVNKNNKSAIAQRKDGIVMFLCLKNASLNDVLTIFQNYGAYNAANLPGGSNSLLMENGKFLVKNKDNVSSVFVLGN